jgi:hypothetical protein
MPKAKSISLYPLTSHEALKHLVPVGRDGVGINAKRRKQTDKIKSKKQQQFQKRKRRDRSEVSE